MSSDRTSISFSQLIASGALAIGDGYRAKNVELTGDGPLFLRSGSVKDNSIDFSGRERLPQSLQRSVADKCGQAYDVVVTTKGNSTGVVAYVPPGSPTFIYSPHLSYWRSLDGDVVDAGYLRYWSRSPAFRQQLKAFAYSTDMAPYLSLADQKRLRIELPPIDEQRRVAGVLRAFDAKIEHNLRMARRLRDLAETSAVTLLSRAAAEGWRQTPIGDAVTVYGGATPSTKEPSFWGGDHAFATPKDLAGLEFPALLRTERSLTADGVARISSGRLPVGTVLLSSRAPIGYLAIAEVPVSVNQGFIAMVCNKRLPNYYVLQWARRNHDAIVAAANGTTFLEISKRAFRPLPIPVPPEHELQAFTELVGPLHRRMVAAMSETQRLRTIRDELLPKLVSGQIQIPPPDAADADADPGA